jgi:hypothetical protein
MKQFARCAAVFGLALFALVVASSVAQALSLPAPQPPGFRAMASEVVIVGKVTSIEEKTLLCKKDGQEYVVGVVQIEQNLKGMKDTTHIRVAWIAPPKPQVEPNPNPNPTGPVLIRPPIGIPRMILAKDQEYLLFLKKHETEGFYIGSNIYSVSVKQGNANFNAEVADVERTLKVAADPLPALKSKDPEERILAVALQINKYRTPRGGNSTQEPINAEESKLILKALAEADWVQNPAIPRPVGSYMTNPQNLFNRIGVTAADGWQQPMNFQEVPAAAKKWLAENADKYAIKRFVEEKPMEK